MNVAMEHNSLICVIQKIEPMSDLKQKILINIHSPLDRI